MRSPCVGCDRECENKEECCQTCIKIKEYQQTHLECSKIQAIDYSDDYYSNLLECLLECKESTRRKIIFIIRKGEKNYDRAF